MHFKLLLIAFLALVALCAAGPIPIRASEMKPSHLLSSIPGTCFDGEMPFPCPDDGKWPSYTPKPSPEMEAFYKRSEAGETYSEEIPCPHPNEHTSCHRILNRPPKPEPDWAASYEIPCPNPDKHTSCHFVPDRPPKTEGSISDEATEMQAFHGSPDVAESVDETETVPAARPVGSRGPLIPTSPPWVKRSISEEATGMQLLYEQPVSAEIVYEGENIPSRPHAKRSISEEATEMEHTYKQPGEPTFVSRDEIVPPHHRPDPPMTSRPISSEAPDMSALDEQPVTAAPGFGSEKVSEKGMFSPESKFMKFFCSPWNPTNMGILGIAACWQYRNPGSHKPHMPHLEETEFGHWGHSAGEYEVGVYDDSDRRRVTLLNKDGEVLIEGREFPGFGYPDNVGPGSHTGKAEKHPHHRLMERDTEHQHDTGSLSDGLLVRKSIPSPSPATSHPDGTETSPQWQTTGLGPKPKGLTKREKRPWGLAFKCFFFFIDCVQKPGDEWFPNNDGTFPAKVGYNDYTDPDGACYGEKKKSTPGCYGAW